MDWRGGMKETRTVPAEEITLSEVCTLSVVAAVMPVSEPSFSLVIWKVLLRRRRIFFWGSLSLVGWYV
jgi:hypothetical protein